MSCSACGAPVGEGARFCASCGRPLRVADDERRVVTVVFADLVGFTTLSERLDPERVKDLVDRCFDELAREVTSFGGQVDKIVGDAMVALFGATTAHEDDPERAVRAALRMQASLCEQAEALGHGLQMRIGVNTGEVLVGAMRAAGSVTAMGDVVNTASRLQTAARPGEVLVGPTTHQATHHTIAYEHRGLLAAKGREEPVETWAAVVPTLPPGYRARRVDVPLVGRDDELALLTGAIETSLVRARALLVLLLGDVGLGKSRLADEVAAAAVARQGAVVREGRCVPYGEANVWWPVADALRPGLGVDDGASHADARASVRGHLATTMGRSTTDPEVVRTAEGLLTLLGYEAAPDVDPATVRQEAGRALGVYAAASARRQPLVLQISDLHWADPAVLTLIDDVFSTLHHCPVVVLATARPALADQWSPRPGRHNQLTVHLDPLGRAASDELLVHLVGADVPEATAEALFERSGGNPFFLEELVSLLDGEAAAAAEPGHVAALPDTLRGLVAARLDDLDPAVRPVLQDASVIGQQGPVVGLREMSRQLGRGIDVDEALAQLVADEIMEVEGAMWSFRSDLVREVAYQTITKADRAKSHLGIARWIEERAADVQPRPPWVVDQLAHHFAAAVTLAAELGPNARTDGFPADLAERARRWVTEAAERSRRDQALPAAIRLYSQAIDLIDIDQPEALPLLLARSAAAAEAWQLDLAGGDAELAALVAERLGDARAGAEAVVARGKVEHRRGDPEAAIATLGEAVARFEELGDRAGAAEALRQRAMVEIFSGQIPEAEASAAAALAAFEAADDRAGQAWSSQNLAWTAFVTGRPDEADRRLAVAVEVFSDLGDTAGLAWSLGLLAWVRFQQRRVAEAQALGEQVLEEARARHDPWATAMMLLLVASVRLWSGRTDEAVELAGQSLRTFTQLGDRYGTMQAGAVRGRALVMSGRVDEGFATLLRAGERGDAPARLTQLAASLQIGEPERAAEVVDDLVAVAGEGIGGDDPVVALAILALQSGDLAEAAAQIDRARSEDHPNVASVRALVRAATGAGGAGTEADRVADLDGATYLDVAIANLAAALEASVADTGAAEAQARLSVARSVVHATEDAVAKAVIEMGAAAVARRLGLPEADEVAAHAEHLRARLGIDAIGWQRAFAAATRVAIA